MSDRLAMENAVLRRGLRSIAANTCCDSCQEAAAVARATLAEASTPINAAPGGYERSECTKESPNG